ncbi:MAG: hypothetical protein IPL31_00010 [Saprospiraceae bacterium]|nr:hypothetical protein [Saprospiraceae bacterium]
MINPEYHFGDTICALDRFVWSTTNQLYNQSGVYIYNHRSHKGCDSIEYLVLMISDGGEVYVPNVLHQTVIKLMIVSLCMQMKMFI